MPRIDYSDIRELPDLPVTGSGTVSSAIADLGKKSFHEAAEYIRNLPYGPNPAGTDLFSLFRDGCGTCLTKHRVVAALAEELDLPVIRMEGIYAMDDSIIPGVSTILKRYGLEYLPRIHCFLESSGSYFDLTEGNCTGKTGLIHQYILIYPGGKDDSEIDERAKFLEYWKELFYGKPAFTRLGIEGLMEAAEECSSHLGTCRLQKQT